MQYTVCLINLELKILKENLTYCIPKNEVKYFVKSKAPNCEKYFKNKLIAFLVLVFQWFYINVDYKYKYNF